MEDLCAFRAWHSTGNRVVFDLPYNLILSNLEYNMYTDIPSFGFSKDYCIFISKKAAPHFAEKVRLTGMRGLGVEVWESADITDDLAMIAIPNQTYCYKIEKDLFDYKNEETHKDVKESGFWGQPNIGYKDKTWDLLEQ